MDLTRNTHGILLIRGEITPFCHERLKEVRILICFSKTVYVNVKRICIISGKKRPYKVLHDMLPKVPGDIADTNLILFSSPPMRVRLHISKERAIA